MEPSTDPLNVHIFSAYSSLFSLFSLLKYISFNCLLPCHKACILPSFFLVSFSQSHYYILILSFFLSIIFYLTWFTLSAVFFSEAFYQLYLYFILSTSQMTCSFLFSFLSKIILTCSVRHKETPTAYLLLSSIINLSFFIEVLLDHFRR